MTIDCKLILEVNCPEEHGYSLMEAKLSTDSSASSYGIPIVLLGGRALGPADLPSNCVGIARSYRYQQAADVRAAESEFEAFAKLGGFPLDR